MSRGLEEAQAHVRERPGNVQAHPPNLSMSSAESEVFIAARDRRCSRRLILRCGKT